MEQKDIDIYEILKGMPDGTPLYTPMCGNVEFISVEADKEKSRAIWTENKNGAYSFDKHGKWMKGGEVLLFPSKQMRDWHKFAWKKGDVLVNSRGLKILFDRLANDNYTSFYAKTINLVEDAFFDTNLHTLASEKEAKSFIKCIEEKLGGKLNLETLKIEQPAFKIGKLYVFDEEDEDGNVTVIGKLIGKNESKDTLTFGNQYEIENEKFVTDHDFDLQISVHEELREATESETTVFQKAYTQWLEKEKKAMRAKEQPVFKPFDKVLVRNGDNNKWQPAFISRDRGESSTWRYEVLLINSGKSDSFTSCIPFEGNEDIAFTDHDYMPF
jgi:hypothetical protein